MDAEPPPLAPGTRHSPGTPQVFPTCSQDGDEHSDLRSWRSRGFQWDAHGGWAGRKQGDRNGEAISSKHEKAQPEALGAHEQTAQSEAWLPVGQRGPGGVCELRRIVPVT